MIPGAWGASEEGVHASLRASLGRQLDPDFPESSWTFEPDLSYRPSLVTRFSLRSVLDKPLDPYEELRIPLIELLVVHHVQKPSVVNWGVFAQTSAQDLHEWSTEGPQLRQAVGLTMRWTPSARWTVELAAGPYANLTHFSQQRNGTRFSEYGLLEQLSVSFRWGVLRLEAVALAVQDWNGKWRSLFSTYERVGVALGDHLYIGIMHQLVSHAVNESTGALQPIGVFDGRDSRLAGFVQWRI